MMDWIQKSRIASHWRVTKKGDVVECMLCPRHCQLKPTQFGFCGVRGNLGNKQHTFNYGLSVPATIEVIETEGIYHFRPGAKILCVGNIGCMLNCDFCQNWQTSQVRYLDKDNVRFYSPQNIVDLCLANNIEIISWTYNDPVVWHEFVLDTAQLTSLYGIKNLYKSALFIEIEPLKELIRVIDIFSISLKSMSPDFYRKYTKGRLAPVLEAIKEISKHKEKHFEISQLIVPGLNDDGTDAQKTAKWVVDNFGPNIPVHFVGFHPAYKYTKEQKTSFEKLEELRNIAMSEGIEYSYLGNINKKDASDTNCKYCGNKLVARYGLAATVIGLDSKGRCCKCSKMSPIIEPFYPVANCPESNHVNPSQCLSFIWNDQSNSIHIVAEDHHAACIKIQVERLPGYKLETIEMSAGLERIIVAKKNENEESVKIWVDKDMKFRIFPLLDRAHFPINL